MAVTRVDTRDVLLIEDSDSYAEALHWTLRETGRFRIIHVVRLEQALSNVAGFQFDVVLLDLTLPDACGLEGLQRLSAAAPDVPILVLTGHEDRELALAALREGAQDYLLKRDVTGELLARAIDYAVERAALMARLRHAHEEIQTLRGLLPICASCKQIRDGEGAWHPVEEYVRAQINVDFSHTVCPDCMERLYPDVIPIRRQRG